MKRGITIKIGYADAEFRKCPNCENQYTVEDKCPVCGAETEFLRRVSFVDAPGHEILMANLLSGAAIMDGAILLIAANEECPQPQTREHLAAMNAIGIKNIVIAQNKIELVSDEEALKNYNQIKKFIKGSVAENAPIIPISALHGVNINYLIKAIEEHIPTPRFDEKDKLRMFIARSFDINKPGTDVREIKGATIGGSIKKGKLRVGDEVVLTPGIKIGNEYKPLYTKVTSIATSTGLIEEAHPGGLIGVSTLLDPSLSKADGLVGNVLSHPGDEPPTYNTLNLEVTLFENVVGTEKLMKVEAMKLSEIIMISIGTATTVGTITSISGDNVEIRLKRPVAGEEGMIAALSRRISGRFRLIGYGKLLS